MANYKENDKSSAICSECNKIVDTTFKYRDVPTSDGKVIIKNLLVAVCDECSLTASTPAQSMPAIKAALDAYKSNPSAVIDNDKYKFGTAIDVVFTTVPVTSEDGICK